jgi:hypothetical protein
VTAKEAATLYREVSQQQGVRPEHVGVLAAALIVARALRPLVQQSDPANEPLADVLARIAKPRVQQ